MGSCQRFVPVILLLGVVSSGCANESHVAEPAAPARQEHLEIELDRPAVDEHIRQPVPFVEVSGRAGTLPFFASDVVLVIDYSTLALVASGIDVDEDGVVGRNRSWVTERGPLAKPAWVWTTDSGDTIEALQLRVARALVPRLSARQNRVGLASSTLRARRQDTNLVRLTEDRAVIVPVGEPGAVLAALADFPPAHERRHTDLGRLLERGAQLLEEAAPNAEPARPRALLLLSHGRPSAPDGIHWSSRRAVEHAAELGERGIALWAIPFGRADTAFLHELTRSSGGNVVLLDRLDAQFGVPGPSDLRPRELEIENLTLGAEATHLRVFPDGRFDAIVPVESGANTLEIRAVLADGYRTTLRRLVHYERARSVEPTP